MILHNFDKNRFRYDYSFNYTTNLAIFTKVRFNQKFQKQIAFFLLINFECMTSNFYYNSG